MRPGSRCAVALPVRGTYERLPWARTARVRVPSYGSWMAYDDSERRWTTLARSMSYSGRVTLSTHRVRIDDASEISYEVDESFPYAVATLVIDDDAVLLARQYRYPINRWIFDLPGGAGTVDEVPRDAAQRELEEELGLVANELRLLHTFYVNPGRAAWPVHVFVCTAGTSQGSIDTSDPAEQVTLVRMTIAELDARVASGEIVDPTLIIARAAAAAQGVLPPLTHQHG